MKRLTYSIAIKAEKETIWKALWDDNSYRKWAGVFFEGSYMMLEKWEVGEKVQFLGSDAGGIYSVIEKHVPNEIIQFKHIGSVVKRKNQELDEETKQWSGATETYQLLEEEEESFLLKVELDVMDEHIEFMSETFPKALEKIKSNCLP